jgi:hypothetical protein
MIMLIADEDDHAGSTPSTPYSTGFGFHDSLCLLLLLSYFTKSDRKEQARQVQNPGKGWK